MTFTIIQTGNAQRNASQKLLLDNCQGGCHAAVMIKYSQAELFQHDFIVPCIPQERTCTQRVPEKNWPILSNISVSIMSTLSQHNRQILDQGESGHYTYT